MPTDVIMPALGMAQETGTVVQWKKRAGDSVVKGEPLLEVETDKAVVEVESPASGTLAAISAEAGTEVPVGTAIALILGAGETEPHVEVGPVTSPLVGRSARDSAPGGEVEELLAATEARLRPASPKARRLATEAGVDLGAVAGTGPEGAVVSADLPEAKEKDEVESELEVGRTWRIMAERTAAAWAAPHFYLTREVMAEPLLAFRAGLAGNRERVKVTDLLVKLSAMTLKSHPQLCSAWRQGRLVKASRISIGVAVAGRRASPCRFCRMRIASRWPRYPRGARVPSSAPVRTGCVRKISKAASSPSATWACMGWTPSPRSSTGARRRSSPSGASPSARWCAAERSRLPRP
jgi:pyruvate dehydrogenase E2 component (dihydrolipoamide acetyltransferase)